ncbi:hypothetical protein M0802_005872 [Mischocyttarus mexicanus]|nr:hypothetical protein M0802_005872 [Mischocyttarus mexicanus]
MGNCEEGERRRRRRVGGEDGGGDGGGGGSGGRSNEKLKEPVVNGCSRLREKSYINGVVWAKRGGGQAIPALPPVPAPVTAAADFTITAKRAPYNLIL